MSETSNSKTKWSLSQQAFDKFLASLHPDRNAAGTQYEQIRCKLIRFFEWRGCSFPEEHADEAITRVIRKLDDGDEIRDPSTYCYGVARMLLLEVFKQQEKEREATHHIPEVQISLSEEEGMEQQVECLKRCLGKLPQDQQVWIVDYYQGDKGTKIQSRKRLAEKLGIPLNALRIRAHRIREGLESCISHCVEKSSGL